MSTSRTQHKLRPDRVAHSREAAERHRDGARSRERPLPQTPPGDRPGPSDGAASWGPSVLRCLPEDARALTRSLPAAPTRRECPGSDADAYLDDLIGKPWGFEARVYDDALVDVWMLHLEVDAETSKHCHPAKDTVLLCLDGNGIVTTGDAREIAISPGSALHIHQGAAHRSSTTSGLTLVEVETPRDKFDLVRLEDLAGRRGREYEHAADVRRTLPPLVSRPDGPPRARLRPPAATGPYRFELEQGIEVDRGPGELLFAISLDPLGILRREIEVAGVDSLTDLTHECTYLTIRRRSSR